MVRLLRSIWYRSKRWRTIPFGPVALNYRLARRVRTSSNVRRDLAARFKQQLPLARVPSRRLETKAAEGVPGATDDPAPGPETAVIVGVGPGLGHALARRFARAGMRVALAARNAERLDPLAVALTREASPQVRAYGCNATDEHSVRALLSRVTREMGTPHIVVYAVQGWHPGRAVEVDTHVFEDCWRQNCLGAFIVAREAARHMLVLKRGTIVLVGSTSGVVGREAHLNLAVGKFGLRALAQVMARELWPDRLHVVHVIIDADIAEDPQLLPENAPQSSPEDIAETIYALHRQAPNAWTSEIDVRPWDQRFWTHC